MGHSGKYRRLTIKISFMEVRIMLVSAKEMLQKAKAGHYAVGQFNINNLEWTKAILANRSGAAILPLSLVFPRAQAST